MDRPLYCGRSMRRLLALLAIVAIAVFVIATAGPPAPTRNPPGTFSFAVLGDAPYYTHEEWQYRIVLKHIGAHDLASVIHVGDVFWRPCADRMYAKHRDWFDTLEAPVIYTPGDNEWYDCWEPRVGGYDPLERLAHLRRTFYDNPARSRGRKPIALASQPGYPENARWQQHGITFATVHIIGSANGRKPFPKRTPAYDDEWRNRTAAAAAWVREAFEAARASNASAVVIAFHANPFFKDAESTRNVAVFLNALQNELRRFDKPVLAVQGDNHTFIADHPWPQFPHFTRLQVPGSPDVGWVRVVVKEGREFTFESHVVPKWKYW